MNDKHNPLGIKILMFYEGLEKNNATSRALRALKSNLEGKDAKVIVSETPLDARAVIASDPELQGVLLHYNEDDEQCPSKLCNILLDLRSRNYEVPVFLLSNRYKASAVPSDILDKVSDFIWILEDTSDFIAGRILAAADAVMVARGDLGVEIDFTELPGIQKTIIDRSFSFGKPIVTATQMLDSMMVNPRPTRAEISDVANAIYDGTSAIMLSGETAAGAYPVEALKTMSAIAERTEQEGHYLRGRLMEPNTGKISVSDATAHAACLTAKDVNAAAIVTVSESGTTARLLSKYRPQQPIIACVMKEQVQRQLSLSWGITSLMMPLAHSTDELIEMSTALAKENGFLHDGELAVVTAGVPVGISGTTNMIKIHMVGNCLATGVGVGPENAEVSNATGKACVCRTLDEVRAKFKPGMVLVVPSTSNEMLNYVRDAAALVVEEPGLNSHAAIAGKALLKPTVVGAVGATSHIRDGLMIAVDCAHGSVQSLQA